MTANSNIYVLCLDGLKVIEQEANGTFTESTLLPLSTGFQYFVISKDERMLIFGSSFSVQIFLKNGANYLLDQTVPKGIDLKGLALSADEKELLLCSSSLSIYKHNGASFVFSQSIVLGSSYDYVNFINDLVEVHGSSSQLKFYEFNGTEYVPTFNIQTTSTFLNGISILEDGHEIMVAGDSQNIFSYRFANYTFEPSE